VDGGFRFLIFDYPWFFDRKKNRHFKTAIRMVPFLDLAAMDPHGPFGDGKTETDPS